MDVGEVECFFKIFWNEAEYCPGLMHPGFKRIDDNNHIIIPDEFKEFHASQGSLDDSDTRGQTVFVEVVGQSRADSIVGKDVVSNPNYQDGWV